MNGFELCSLDLSRATEIRSFCLSLTKEFLDEVRPYVYMVFHKRTMDFYFGFRCANRSAPSLDLGNTYLTSCSTIKKSPNEYYFKVLKTFKSSERAYSFEQRLIKAHIKNPKCLNRHWQTRGTFSMLGSHRPDVAEYNRRTKTKQKVSISFQCEHCRKVFTKTDLPGRLAQLPKYCTKSCATSASSRGREPWNKGLLLPPAWNKGIHNPNGASNGRKGAEKLAKKVTGRKMAVDKKTGRRYWVYPNSNAQFRAAA